MCFTKDFSLLKKIKIEAIVNVRTVVHNCIKIVKSPVISSLRPLHYDALLLNRTSTKSERYIILIPLPFLSSSLLPTPAPFHPSSVLKGSGYNTGKKLKLQMTFDLTLTKIFKIDDDFNYIRLPIPYSRKELYQKMVVTEYKIIKHD
jgi:hypothetical protein